MSLNDLIADGYRPGAARIGIGIGVGIGIGIGIGTATGHTTYAGQRETKNDGSVRAYSMIPSQSRAGRRTGAGSPAPPPALISLP
jgi:hypothetical protein